MTTVAAAVLAVVLVATCASPSLGKHVTGTVSSDEGFQYLSKFCFDYNENGHPEPAGMLEIQLSPDSHYSTDLMLLIYDDQPESWPQIYGKDIPCPEKVTRAKNWQPGGIAHVYRPHWEGDNPWRLPLVPIHEHARPRFWYIVAANCRGFDNLGYDIQFTNMGSAWSREWSVNEQGQNTLYIGFTMFYIFLLFIHLYGVRKQVNEQNFVHPIVKILTATVFFQWAGVFLKCLHMLIYTEDGSGAPFIDFIGDSLMELARVSFILLLILLANGFTISTDEIRNKGTIVGGIVVFLSLYLLLVIWDFVGRDPASTLYVYESVPGYLIVLTDLAAGIWFHVSISKSHREETKKAKVVFYRILWAVYGVWFLVLPAIVLVAHFLDPWDRESAVMTISMWVTTLIYSSMVFLLWPSRASEYFAISTPDVSAGHTEDDL